MTFNPAGFPMDMIDVNDRQMRNLAQGAGKGRLSRTWLAYDHHALHPQNILCICGTVKQLLNLQSEINLRRRISAPLSVPSAA